MYSFLPKHIEEEVKNILLNKMPFRKNALFLLRKINGHVSRILQCTDLE